MHHPLHTLAGCLLAVAASASTAAAETVTVSPGDDVQAAIDALEGPDNTVVFKSGTYVVNLVIPPGLDGLTLRGAGKVFLDGYAEVDGLDDVITVRSPDVTISRLTIRHAPDKGVWIEPGLDAGLNAVNGTTVDRVVFIGGFDGVESDAGAGDTTVSGCTFIGLLANPVRIQGDDATIERCRVERCGGDALYVNGDRARVERNTAELVEDGQAIEIDGDDAVVISNTTARSQNQGIDIDGDRARVEKNRVSKTHSSSGIEVDGADAVVSSNRVEVAGDHGVNVLGSGALVERNTITTCRDHALRVDGSNVRILSNRIDGTGDEDAGVFLRGPADEDPGGEPVPSLMSVVSGNRVSNAYGYGYDLVTDGSTVERNLADNCGTEQEGGFRVDGTANEIERNTAKDCTRDGFFIRGVDNVLTRNSASDCTVNGFEVDEGSHGNLLDGNRAKGCQGQGLQNDGSGTRIKGNTFVGNRLDVANDTKGGASLIDEGKNKIGTGDDLATPPDVDEP